MKRKLEATEGVVSAEVSHETGEATVTMAPGKVLDEEGVRSELDKDMYTLTDCEKQVLPTN